MENRFQIALDTGPNPNDDECIRAGLEEYNRQFAPDANISKFSIFLRDEEGQLAGGLLGGTYWGALYVEILWLREDVRHAGFGSRLLEMAEDEARRRGCRHAHLDTIDFQAPEFYKKQGYEVWGELDDIPPGHRRIFLRKEL